MTRHLDRRERSPKSIWEIPPFSRNDAPSFLAIYLPILPMVGIPADYITFRNRNYICKKIFSNNIKNLLARMLIKGESTKNVAMTRHLDRRERSPKMYLGDSSFQSE